MAAKKKKIKESISLSQVQRQNKPGIILRLPMKASYDAADASDQNRHWANADALSAKRLNSAATRNTLRNRARYEVASNTYAFGIESTLVNDTIGRGPRPQVLGVSRELKDRIENDFYYWSEDVRLAEKLRTARAAKFHDGEAFLLAIDNPRLPDITLDIVPVEAEQVATPDLMESVSNAVDGIVYDKSHNPIEYHVLKEHPGDYWTTQEYDKIPAGRMYHWFRATRPGQLRGVPEITPALPLFGYMRRFINATVAAAETAANFSAVLQCQMPPDSETDPVSAMEELEIAKNMMLTLPAGYTMSQFKAENPNAEFSPFIDKMINMVARCLNMPFNVAAGNSAGYNYASGRLDYQVYFKSLKVDQSHCENVILNPLFYEWLTEWQILNRSSATDGLWVQWYWDGTEHVDPLKEANAQTERLANMTTTLANECAKMGIDWMDQLKQIAVEREEMKRLGLTPVAKPETKQEDEEDVTDEN